MEKITESKSIGVEDHSMAGLGRRVNRKATGMQGAGGGTRSSGRGYMCSICYEAPVNPVLTQCGHLFCWECIYTWSQSIVGGCRVCPACRDRMDLNEVIPMASDKSAPKKSGCPPPPTSSRKPVKVILGGLSVNGTRFGNSYLHEDGGEVFSYRTVVGLLCFFCILAAWMLKTHYFGTLL
jgi:hypothetical protein